MSPLILVVEDEPSLVTLLRYNLEREDFRVAFAGDGEEALLLVREQKPDLVLLDGMLPVLSGADVCRQLRRMSGARRLPILMLIAGGEAGDRARGLDNGADGYVTKPFSPSELMARIRSMLPRPRAATIGKILRFEDIAMDVAERRVCRGGREIRLNPAEFRLLRYLIEHQGRIFSREQVLDVVRRGDRVVDARIVDVYIRRLRRALDTGNGIDFIRTVRSGGYALDRPAPSDRTYGKKLAPARGVR